MLLYLMRLGKQSSINKTDTKDRSELCLPIIVFRAVFLCKYMKCKSSLNELSIPFIGQRAAIKCGTFHALQFVKRSKRVGFNVSSYMLDGYNTKSVMTADQPPQWLKSGGGCKSQENHINRPEPIGEVFTLCLYQSERKKSIRKSDLLNCGFLNLLKRFSFFPDINTVKVFRMFNFLSVTNFMSFSLV